MPATSFRDRFYSPSVSRALTSPSGILALGGGVAAGIVVAAVAAAALPVTIAAAVVGGAVAYGGRVALAIPRRPGGGNIDPFGVDEPWRRSVQESLRAQARFRDAVETFRAGPLRDSMATVRDQFDEAVDECWKVAQQGQIVADARKRINDREVRWQLTQSDQAAKDGRVPNATQQQTIAALQAQLGTADRMDALISNTKDQLDLLTARLDESVTRAIELSVSNRLSDASDLGDDVGEIVTDLESLRMAIEDVDSAEAEASRSAAAPPPPMAAPPPLPPPPTALGGQGQASPGT